MSDSPDCTDRCCSEVHGEILCAALTKRSVTDSQLCAFLTKTCCCCGTVKDPLGRNSLHITASCGRTNVAKWLINFKHANINAKDGESGYTPLHRSIYYGKIHTAVSLIKMGACLNVTDLDGLTVLEHAMKDLKLPLEPCTLKSGEIYVWGQNTNYTVGTQQARSIPERFDSFHKEYPNLEISTAYLEKFHSILLTSDGRVFASGHGHGGRLGLSSEEAVLSPKQIHFGKSMTCKITHASIARDHSVFLNENGQVFTCGLNTHKVLGLNPPPPNVLSPRQVQINDIVIGICAARYHTVAFTKEKIYTWGLNGGQIGLDKTMGQNIVVPKLVTALFGSESQIKLVATSNGATTVYTTKGDMYVLHEHQCRKIASKQLNVISISVVGGKLNLNNSEELLSKENYELKIVVLNSSGNVLIWQETRPLLTKCSYLIGRAINITQISLNAKEMLFVTREGEAFQGIIKPRKNKSEINSDHHKKNVIQEFFEKEDFQVVKLKKFPRVHRGFAIYSDLKGLNYAVLQYNPKTYQRLFPDISSSSLTKDLEILLENVEEEDEIHDIVFKVNNKKFPAHKFICALSSSKMEEMFSNQKTKTKEHHHLIENEEDEYIFESLLRYFYTGTCDLLEPTKFKECCEKYSLSLQKDVKKKGEVIEQVEKDSVSPNSKAATLPKANPLFALRDLAKKFGVKELNKHFEGLTFINGTPKFKQPLNKCKSQKFRRESLPQFHDVRLVSKDKQVIWAHKCILVARMEYFENFFSVRWTMNACPNEISLSFPHAVLDLLLEYLYSDDLPLTIEMDSACNLLIAADHFLIPRLKEKCELSISSHLSLKNVSQLVRFSYTYNASQLRDCCMEFILHNLPALLEMHALETIEENILCDLSEFYANFNRDICHRVMTPYSNAPSDEAVVAAAKDYLSNISFTDREEEDEVVVKSVHKSTKKRNRTRKSSSGNNFKRESMSETSTNATSNICDDKKDEESKNGEELNNETDDRNIQVSKLGIVVKNRIDAIVNANEKIGDDNFNYCNYKMLPLKQEDADVLDVEEFPYLGKDTSHSYLSSQSPGKAEKPDIKTNFTKLSQKQRKRLSSEGGTTNEKEILAVSPKNPWKTLIDPTSPVGSPEKTIDSIITDEKKMKENLVKMKTKSLFYTQIEDHAIEDLLKFYNADNVYDEIVTVTRVQNTTAIASPLWIHSNKMKT